MIIYCATNKYNGKKYIGQTINSLDDRIKGHMTFARLNKEGCRLFWRAIRKYGEDSFVWEILKTVNTREELDEMESYYISLYNTTNKNSGYNLKGGGYNPFLTDEVKNKISESQKGELNHMYGKHGKDNPNSIMVYNVTDNKMYDSATICSIETGLSISKICSVCRGERATTGNKVFRYVIDGIVQEVFSELKKKSKKVQHLESGLVFDSIIDCSNYFYGNKNSTVYRELKKANGKFRYLD